MLAVRERVRLLREPGAERRTTLLPPQWAEADAAHREP